MKTKILYPLLFGFISVFYCCNSGDSSKIEYKKTYHRNGKVHEITPFVNGKAHGIKLEYYDDGALRKETPYDSGKVHGTVKFYYTDGKLFSETPRVSGKIHGIVKKYHKNGSLHSETPYENDEVLPGLREYNQRGVLLEQPKIVFETKKEKRTNDMLVNLEMRLSSGKQSVKFYQSVSLSDSTYKFSSIPVNDGVGVVSAILPPGSNIDKELLIRAEFTTSFNNRCVLEQNYRIKAQN